MIMCQPLVVVFMIVSVLGRVSQYRDILTTKDLLNGIPGHKGKSLFLNPRISVEGIYRFFVNTLKVFFYNVFQPTREHPPSSLRWDKSS